MALTPSQSRMSASTWAFRQTTSNSPFTRAGTVKIPSKSGRADAGLSLKHVIGTTASSANAIATHPPSRSLAFTAGAAAVLATFDSDLQITQRFYRARPTAIPLNPTPIVYSPSTPVNPSGELRTRAAATLRDAGAGMSPFGTPNGDWADSPGGKPWSARERVKAATCVSLSPDGKYLAIGETGYKPRVLIFSTSKESSPDAPLTCLPDHTFGVRCVAFSADSQYLASLGAANDGYLYVWKINNRNGAATLYASNKCTSNISQIAWMGKNLVTVGTRHVKLWRVEGSTVSSPIKSHSTTGPTSPTSSLHRILYGRNCLLNDLIESTFTSVTAIGSTKAIVCSDTGDICLLDDATNNQAFAKIGRVNFGITSSCLDLRDRVLLTGREGRIRSIPRKSFLEGQPFGDLGSILPNDSDCPIPAPFLALAPLVDHVVAVDANRFIKLLKSPSDGSEARPDVTRRLPAHGAPVLGVRPCHGSDQDDVAFFTWAADGTVLFWTQDGTCKHTVNVELEQADGTDDGSGNELRVVRAFSRGTSLVTGDKYGVLRVLHRNSSTCSFRSRAHAGEITDIAVHETKTILMATGGRDRTVQIFKPHRGEWDLVQTLDEHVGAVTGLLFASDGAQLISSSSDRTIVVRDALTRDVNGKTMTAFAITRTITLKATPISMTLPSDRGDVLFLSAVDRSVHRYNLRTGHHSNSFKVSDNEGSDAVVLSSLIYIPTLSGQNLIAGVSTTDKSVRMYDENGTIFGRDWGHTEGVTDLTLVSTANAADQRCLVSVAADGTVFIWSIGPKSSNKRDISRSMDLLSTTPTGTELLVNKPPLRRVLSQSELSRFHQRSPEREEDTTTTPTTRRTAKLEKRISRFSLAQPPRLDPSPITSFDPTRRRTPAVSRRSPSPPASPKTTHRSNRNGRLSLDPRARTKSNGALANDAAPNGVGSLVYSTDMVCRNLRTYRKKLASSSDHLEPETLRELERELALTARAVGEKATKSRGVLEESMMVKLLNQYSERLMEMLDSKFAARKENEESTSRSGSLDESDAAAAGAGDSPREDDAPPTTIK